MKLLIVCTGNICRSAAAEVLLRTASAHLPGSALTVRSAGTHAVDGRPIHPHTARALAQHNVDPGDFRSQRLTAEHVMWADLVLTMTSGHREAVVGIEPRGLRKVATLHEAALLVSALPLPFPEGPDRGGLVAQALSEARARHRLPTSRLDVVDPIDGPAQLHHTVVDEIVATLRALLPLLNGRPEVDATVRMPRLPPVPYRT